MRTCVRGISGATFETVSPLEYRTSQVWKVKNSYFVHVYVIYVNSLHTYFLLDSVKLPSKISSY